MACRFPRLRPPTSRRSTTWTDALAADHTTLARNSLTTGDERKKASQENVVGCGLRARHRLIGSAQPSAITVAGGKPLNDTRPRYDVQHGDRLKETTEQGSRNANL